MNPYNPLIRYMYQQLLRGGILNLPTPFISLVSSRFEWVAPPNTNMNDLSSERYLPGLNLKSWPNWGNVIRGWYVSLWHETGTSGGYGPGWWFTAFRDDINLYWRAMQ